MTRRYSTAIVCLRALATVKSTATLALSHALHLPSRQLMAAMASSSSSSSSSAAHARPLSGHATKSLHFYNIRPLNLKQLQHQPQPFTFDFAREGLDFSIWKIEVASGLSQSQYEYIRQMVEDRLNTQFAAGLVSHDALMAQDQGPLFNSATSPASVDMTTEKRQTCIRAVAMYDTDIGCDARAECKLFFFYLVGKDPTTSFSLIRRKNKRLLTLTKTVPIVDALRDVAESS
jgi:hypothetical protein